MRVFLLCSLALNLFLIAGLVAARVDLSHVDERSMPGSFELPVSLAPGGAQLSDPAALRERLAGAGFQESDIRVLVHGWLEAGARAAWRDEGPDYWEAGYVPARAAASRQAFVGQTLRAALVELFGEEARHDPTFAAAFRPLDPAYAFLSSAQQIAIERFSVEQLSVRAPNATQLPRSTCIASAAPPPPGAARGEPPSLASLLDDSSLSEYMMRFSDVAGRLRQLELDDEADFRDAFSLTQSLLEREPDPAAQVRGRQALRQRLGDARFNLLWSGFDPLYAPVENYLRGQGFTEHQVRAAYSVVNRAQESLLALFSNPPGDRELLAAASRIRQEEASQLTRLLGAEAAAGLSAAATRVEFELSADPGQVC